MGVKASNSGIKTLTDLLLKNLKTHSTSRSKYLKNVNLLRNGVHYPTHEWWISNTAIGHYKNQWSEIKWIGWKYDTASEEVLTSVHYYNGLQIPSVENQSWWPSHHHQSTKHKNWEVITSSPAKWMRKLIRHFEYKSSHQSYKELLTIYDRLGE